MSSKIKSEHLLLCFFPLFTFYFPTVRLGSVPIRFEDIICIVLMFLVILNSKSTNNKVNIGIVFSFLIMLITLFFSTNYYNLIGVTINFKTLIVGLSYVKYVLFFFVVKHFFLIFEDLQLKSIFIKNLQIVFLTQILILILQKFDIADFASGAPFYFVVKFYSIPNIYATSTDLDTLISTHLNFKFRPAGTFGSSTITGVSMFVVGHILYLHTKNILWKILSYFAIVICFAKIAIVLALFIDFILPAFSGRKNAIRNILFLSPPLLVVGYFIIEMFGVMHNLIGALNGTDRGVTHRLDVVLYMLNMSGFEFFLGNMGDLPFDFFDSGVLLSIFRYGIVFFILEYFVLYKIFNSCLKNSKISQSFCFCILFADLTFGSILNPVFSSLIFLMLISTVILKEDYKRKVASFI
jgi:hypothetical protein